MKKIFIIISLILPLTSYAKRHGCPLENTIYFAYDSNHMKAVELCKVGEYYKYTYGPISNPEVIITKPIGAAEIQVPLEDEGNGFEVVDGNSVYRVFEDDLDGPHISFYSRTPFKELSFSLLDSDSKTYIDKTAVSK